jgi:two-component system, OmpR family, response regulator TctD
MRILVVEDNLELAEMLLDRLRAEGHAVDHEGDGKLADDLLRHSNFDLVILDINLPGLDGYSILKSMRARSNKTPVLVLTARSQVDDRIAGLDSGADDYMVKPFDFRELAARCRVLLRRRSGEASNQFQCGNFCYDRSAKRATLDGVDLDLKNRELQLLEMFLGNLGRVIAKEDVADKVYSYEEAHSLNAIEQAVTRLRRKLESSPLRIRTIRGLGYIADVQEN